MKSEAVALLSLPCYFKWFIYATTRKVLSIRWCCVTWIFFGYKKIVLLPFSFMRKEYFPFTLPPSPTYLLFHAHEKKKKVDKTTFFTRFNTQQQLNIERRKNKSSERNFPKHAFVLNTCSFFPYFSFVLHIVGGEKKRRKFSHRQKTVRHQQ